MKTRRRAIAAALVALALLAAGLFLFGGWFGAGPLEKDRTFVVSTGDSLGAVAQRLEKEGMIASASSLSLRARLFGGGSPINAGELRIPAGASAPRILSIIHRAQGIRRPFTIT